MVLREDLSHQPRLAVSDFAKIRFINMDEIRLRPGRVREFTEFRSEIATAYAAADVDGPVWVYEIYSGGPTNSFQIWTPYNSVAQLDLVPRIRKSVDKALGDAGRTRASPSWLKLRSPNQQRPSCQLALGEATRHRTLRQRIRLSGSQPHAHFRDGSL